MKPLFILLGTFIISCLIIKWTKQTIDYTLAARVAMACMLMFTAVGHFFFLEGMSKMLPSGIPFKIQLVALTGIMELLFAIMLLFPQFQKLTGWVLILFFILILPANIFAALHQINYKTGLEDGPGSNYLWFRIPLQFFFMFWVYFSNIR